VALEIIEASKKNTVWSTRRCIILATISLILGIVIFALAYIGMQQGTGIGALNQPILSFMIEHRDPNVTNIMKIITSVVNPLSFAIVIFVIASIWAFFKSGIWRPILLAIAMSIATILSTILKVYIMNVRPPQINMIIPFELDYSFPSAHTIVIAVFLLVLGYLICSRHSSGERVSSWIIVTIIGIGVIATSRLYLGYHWLTDVIASVGLSLIILALIIFIDIIAVRRTEN
jgi:undecaprenyl-diphosphatase